MKRFLELLGEYETLVKECHEAWHSGTGNVPGTNYAALADKAQAARKDLVDYFAERTQQRDDARRELCKAKEWYEPNRYCESYYNGQSSFHHSPEEYAESRGWGYLYENQED